MITQKAQVTQVPIGNDLTIEGLLLPDGSFGVAVPQIANLFPYFQDDQNQAAKKLKRLMGAHFKTTKIKTPFNKNATLYVTLDDFVLVLKALTKKEDAKAKEMLLHLVGLSLHQLFCDAFKIKFDEDDRQEWLKLREKGKKVRRTFTDAIKDYILRNNISKIEAKHIYANATDSMYIEIFKRKAENLRKDWGVDKPKLLRDYMDDKEIDHIEAAEDLAMRLVDQDNLHPVSAAREAVKTLRRPPSLR